MSIFNSKKFLIFIALICLTLNFSNHYFSTLPLKRFIVNDFPSESHAYSRMLFDETHDVSDRGGFMVHYDFFNDFDPYAGREDYEGLREKARTAKESEIQTYDSHLSLQHYVMVPVWSALRAIRDTVIEKSREGSRWQKRMQKDDTYYFILISQTVVALFNAAILSFFLLWVARQFSTPVAFVTLPLFMILIPAMTYFGRSMWWLMGFWFIPFLVMAYAYQINKGRPLNVAGLMISALSAGVGLFLCTGMGYEYSSTVMVSAVIPATFYAIQAGWSKKDWFIQCLVIGLAQISGFALTLYMHYKALLSIGADPIYSITQKFQGRAYGGDVIGNVEGLVEKSVHAGIPEVIAMNFFLPQTGGIPEVVIMLPLFIWLWQRRKIMKEQTATTKALLVSIALGAFGAISMFVILKGHSYIHGYDIIAWSIPMNLLLAVFYAQWIIQSYQNAQRT